MKYPSQGEKHVTFGRFFFREFGTGSWFLRGRGWDVWGRKNLLVTKLHFVT